jgi:UDPglucose 6-dehydrogenase
VYYYQDMYTPKVSIIGSGYVGLITGILFSKKGFETVCLDVIQDKVDAINQGLPPFFEPELEKILVESIDSGEFSASIDRVNVIRETDISFICVGTPSLPDGSANLTFIKSAAKDIGLAIRNIEKYHLIVVKSTIPPGTTERVILPLIEETSAKKVGIDFGLCMNPEFLKQGSAVKDAFNPDRIIIGEYDKKSGDILEPLFTDFNCPIMRCEIKAAELIKYAANSLLATKISFANEFARVCEKFNVDVYEVMKGIGFDYRINPRFLNAGCGFGGSCFPKDVKAIISIAEKMGVATPVLDSVIETNELQPIHMVNMIKDEVGNLKGKKIGFLGLSFKPNTDDVRETRALPIIRELVNAGAIVKAYDPQAKENFRKRTSLPVEYKSSWEEVLRNSDFSVIHTEWDEIKQITEKDFLRLQKTPLIFDCRRTYNPMQFITNGIQYKGIGWKNKENEKRNIK